MTMELDERGAGPPVLLIHGSAADYSTWSVQLASLAADLRLLAYNRRVGRNVAVEEHADDAVALVESRLEGSCVVVGSSFGGVVALDMARRHPRYVKSLVVCEPPLAPSDYSPAAPSGFGCRFDALCHSSGGRGAAEFFLRTVLGDATFDAMPKKYQERTRAAFPQIRADMIALARYRVDYANLVEQISCPVHLVGGDRSAPFYADTLDALHSALPGSERHVLRGAGHMMQVDGHRQFNALLKRVCAVGPESGESSERPVR